VLLLGLPGIASCCVTAGELLVYSWCCVYLVDARPPAMLVPCWSSCRTAASRLAHYVLWDGRNGQHSRYCGTLLSLLPVV